VFALFAALDNIPNSLTNQRQIIVSSFGFSALQTTLLGCVDGVIEILTIFSGVKIVSRIPNSIAYVGVIYFTPNILSVFLVNFLFQFCSPNTSEKDLLARFAKLNVGPGQTFDFSKFSPEIQLAIKDGIKDSDADLAGVMKRVNTDEVSSGDMFGTRDFLKDNYLYRYVGAKLGLYGNSKQDALYFGYFIDSQNQPLNASKSSYELRFAKDLLPPNNAFWSLTMYDAQSFFVENPINRYNIAAWMPLKYNKDGSLDIYIQRESPGKEKQANWLPAAEGSFSVTMRIYWPKPEALDGTWKPSPIAVAQQ